MNIRDNDDDINNDTNKHNNNNNTININVDNDNSTWLSRLPRAPGVEALGVVQGAAVALK